MKRLVPAVLVLVVTGVAGVVLGQGGAAPSDDCTAPVVQIAPLDFYWGTSVPFSDDVDLSDLGACAAGPGVWPEPSWEI